MLFAARNLMANKAIKKRLLASIISIAAASALLVVCVAAYYSSSSSGSDNVTGAANFVVNAAFESDGVTLTDDSRLSFKNTTVLNAVKVTDVNIGDANYTADLHNRYLTDGDDSQFNQLALLIKTTVTNSSGTDVYARLSVSTATEVGLEYFCLTDAEAQEVLTAINASETPTYDEYFRAAFTAYAAASPETAPKETDYAIYREYLYAVNEYTVSARNAEQSSLVIGAGSSATRYIIVWLDWRKYAETVNAESFVPTSMPVTIAAAITNQAGGAP